MCLILDIVTKGGSTPLIWEDSELTDNSFYHLLPVHAASLMHDELNK